MSIAFRQSGATKQVIQMAFEMGMFFVSVYGAIRSNEIYTSDFGLDKISPDASSFACVRNAKWIDHHESGCEGCTLFI